MNNLSLINDSTLLSRSKVYQIDRVLYTFLFSTDSIRAPQFVFKPLPGQKKKANLQLNHKTLIRRCYVVQGMTQNITEVTSTYVQLALPI